MKRTEEKMKIHKQCICGTLFLKISIWKNVREIVIYPAENGKILLQTSSKHEWMLEGRQTSKTRLLVRYKKFSIRIMIACWYDVSYDKSIFKVFRISQRIIYARYK